MSFRDFPFPEGTSLFPSRSEVLAYLHRFADSMNARTLTRFRTNVDLVERVSHNGTGKSKWRILSHSLDIPNKVLEDTFDYVAIASGWARVPHVPFIPGMGNFRGAQLHSAWYRTPVAFRGKRVFIVGNFSSGADIARELCGGSVRTFEGYEQWQRDANASPSGTGTVVYHSYRDPTKPPPLDYYPLDDASPDWCKRINVVSSIEQVNQDGSLALADGNTVEADVIIWATGFWRSLPYIDASRQPFCDYPLVPELGAKLRHPNEATPLTVFGSDILRGASCLTNLDDWQIFYEPDKTLALLGVPVNVIPFPFTHVQARVIACTWAGLMGELPKLRPNRATQDPLRWSDIENGAPRQLGKGITPISHDIQTPSEEAYLGMLLTNLDALVSYLPGEEGKKRPAWDIDARARGPEGFAQLAHWRIDRLHNRIKLRRSLLHY